MKILIIEDHPSVQECLKEAFEDRGIEVTQIFNYLDAAKAVESYELKSFDPILWDGELALDKDHQKEIRVSTPLIKLLREKDDQVQMIAMSGDLKIMREQLEAGCNRAIEKNQVFESVIGILGLS